MILDSSSSSGRPGDCSLFVLFWRAKKYQKTRPLAGPLLFVCTPCVADFARFSTLLDDLDLAWTVRFHQLRPGEVATGYWAQAKPRRHCLGMARRRGANPASEQGQGEISAHRSLSTASANCFALASRLSRDQ